MKSKRFEVLSQRPVNQDGYVKEWVEEGFIAMESPQDPKPSLKIEGGRIVELDGKRREDFDLIDTFIANYGIVLDGAQEAMAKDSKEIANMMLTPSVPREEIVKICKSITPAKMLEVVSCMNVVEMMQCMQKMRARRTMANQAHVTNVNDNPVQIAADAAEGALRGFAEEETTVAVARYAPLNAISLLVGSQCGRPGVLTQCSLEEATELELGMRGFTAYAETISVYGTEDVFTDGDDTPWSKGFLASAYASRGLKMRFTSGTGSEVTPFAVISDKANNRKYPIADYSLTPTVAIVDPALVLTVPGFVAADTGMDVLTHATEAYVSQMASDYTDGLALQAIKLVFENLESSVKNADFHSREKMHNASTIAGMAFANAFLGISHSMAHKIGAQFHTIHGRTNAILLPYVIRYNGTRPAKTATWPKYNYYRADEKYQDIARMLGLPASTPEEGVESYAKAVYELGERVGIQMNFKAQGIDEKEWKKHSRELAFLAYEDQCSPANPRLPMVDHMQEIIEDSYYGYKERPGRRK